MDTLVQRARALHDEAVLEHKQHVKRGHRLNLVLLAFFVFVVVLSVLLLSGGLSGVKPDLTALSGHLVYALILCSVFILGLFAIIAYLYAQINRMALLSARLIATAFELGQSDTDRSN